jgi:hypothetical protein
MFFTKKKKEEQVSDESEAVKRAPRYDSMAIVCINGFEGQALLKNISNSGFCMQSKTFAALTPGEKYILKIFPEKTTGLGDIEVEVEVRWIRSEVSKFESGFLLTKPLAAQDLNKYIDYLKTQTEPGKLRTAS